MPRKTESKNTQSPRLLKDTSETNGHSNSLTVPELQLTSTSRPSDINTRPTQPDGGWGWVVCLTSMACNGTVFGIINTFGILYVAMLDHYAKGDPNISFKTAWVGSVTIGLTFFMCMFSSIISDRVGIRKTGVFGGICAFAGILASAFVEELMLLYLTFGILMGVGFAFSYAPSLIILGHYFKKKMGLVNGLVTFGSSAFTMALALGIPKMLDAVGFRYTLIFLAGIVLLLIPEALTWKPIFTREVNPAQAAMSTLSIEIIQSKCTDCCNFTKKYLNVKIWKNKGYVVWSLSLGLSLFGYFVPFVHVVKFVKDKFPDANGEILLICIAIASGVSRMVVGKLADFKCVNRIRLQQASLIIMGVCTLCIPFSHSFGGLIAITLFIGVCDGTFICLLGPIAFDIVGETNASQALGFLFGIFSIPMTIGPPVAGLLYDHLGSYNVAFHLAGCPPILGALLMLLVPKHKPTIPAITSIEEFAAVSCHDIYHSKLSFEQTIGSPGDSRVTPEIITLKDVSEITNISTNKNIAEEIIPEETDTSKLLENGKADVSNNYSEAIEPDTKKNSFTADGNVEKEPEVSDSTSCETDSMLPDIKMSNSRENIDV